MLRSYLSSLAARLTMLSAVVVAAGLLTFTPGANADKIHLKDGRVFEGEVIREVGDLVFFAVQVGDVSSEMLFNRSDIEKIEQVEKTEAQAKKEENRRKAKELPPGATRVAFLTLGDQVKGSTVGIYMESGILRECGNMLKELPEEEKPDVLILTIDSGGGLLADVHPLSDVIHLELKPHFRVVAWIESAISAAAMTALNCEEIVMMPQGNIGGAVAYAGGRAAQGAQLQQILALGQLLAERGKWNPDMVIAMQMPHDLSVDIDEENNTVIWYNHTNGEYPLNWANMDHHRNILTLNAAEAAKFRLASGICETKEEIVRHLGYTEWVEVGQEAEARMQEYLDDTKRAEARLRELAIKYQSALGIAESMRDRRERGRWVGQARNNLNEIRSIVRRSPPMKRFNDLGIDLNDEFFREQERYLRDLLDED